MALTVPPWHCPSGLTDEEQAEVDSRLPITIYPEEGGLPTMSKKIVAKPAPKPSKSSDSSAKLKAVKPSKKYGK